MHLQENQTKGTKRRPFSRFFENYTVPVQAVLVVCVVIMSAVIGWGMVPEQASWVVGSTAKTSIQADRSVIYEDTEATKNKRDEALEAFQPVYKLNLDQFNNLSLVAIDRAFESLQKNIVNTGSTPQENRKKNLVDEFGFQLSEEEWDIVFKYDAAHIELLHKQAVALSSNEMGKGVSEIGLAEAKKRLLNSVDQSRAFSAVDRTVVHTILDKITYYATHVVDQTATEQKKNEILASVEPVRHAIQKDQVVVTKGEKISERQYDALKALGYTNDNSTIVIVLGVLLALAIVFVGLYVMIKLLRKLDREKTEEIMAVILTVMTLIVLSFPAFTSIQFGSSQFINSLTGFLVPVTAVGMMVAILLGFSEAIIATLAVGLFLGLYTNNIFIAFASVVGSLAGISQVKAMRRRTDLTMAGLIAGAAMACVVVAYSFMQGLPFKALLIGVAYAIINGFLSVILTMGFLPYIERAYNMTTSLTLQELCDPNMPLQRALMHKAPGTYQHSLMVANLAEAAALRIGADAQLVRTAAYYHDIGKLVRPEFFSENQMKGKNPHDKISPTLSTLIITSHLKDGIAMAREERLPEPIIELIGQHHGNSPVSFFYIKAQEIDPTLSKDDFRYNAKRPQTREAAVLMLADTVEAAVRSNIHRLNHGQIDGFIRTLIQAKVDDKQLVECNMTFKDIKDVSDEFSRVVNSIYHKRIIYPDKKSLEK